MTVDGTLETQSLRLTCLRDGDKVTGVALEVRQGQSWSRMATTSPLSHLIYKDKAGNRHEVALAANALNSRGGGGAIKSNEGYLGFDRMASPAELRALATRMNTGGVSLLMVRGANPAFTLPKSVGFAEAMARVPFKVSFSSYPDETSELADLILPDHHSLQL